MTVGNPFIRTKAAKTVTLDAEACEIPAKVKRPREAFSQVVQRIVRPRRPLTDFAGAWRDTPASRLREFERWCRERRKKDPERQKQLREHWR